MHHSIRAIGHSATPGGTLRCFVLVSLLVLILAPRSLTHAAQVGDERCFPETKQCIRGRFLEYWEQNGGLAVFGYPISEASNQVNRDTGKTYLTQWFERNRFELHPENARPYDVLLGRLGEDRLLQQAINWRTLPRADGARTGCLWFAETRHNVCDQATGAGFKSYWQSHGLQDPRMNSR